ncbi:MAG: TetR/AcrR family transcriptional regulator [Planctomycetes bacterium]|nr:TetR/AcrR family transcriptional regulator [Planctomycetota bacterium]
MVYRATDHTRARKAERRQAILSAAREVVARGDFARLRISDVARDAGVATGTVYRYFPNKVELSLEVFRLVSGIELAFLEQLSAEPSEPIPRFKTLLRAFVLRALERPRLAYALLAEPLPEAVAAERLRYRREFAKVFARLIEEGIATGDLPPQDAALSATWLVGALSEALYGPLIQSSQRERLLPTLTALALQSIGIRPGGTL